MVRHDRSAQWRALGTYVQVSVAESANADDLAAVVGVVEDVLAHVDLACSRFRADSELVALNRGAGSWTPVSPVLWGALQVACSAAEQTDGLVSPTLGVAVRSLGYDQSFEILRAAAIPAVGEVGGGVGGEVGGAAPVATFPTPSALPPEWADPQLRRDRVAAAAHAWREIAFDPDARAVRLPVGAEVDLGATGKAYAADLAAAQISAVLGVSALVSLGGDIACSDPTGDQRSNAASPIEWPIAIGHTLDDALATDAPIVWLRAGGLATSSTQARQWVRGGRRWNHLINPRTGECVDGPYVTVTALGRSAAAANTATTAALVLGAGAPAWLRARGVEARLLGPDGQVVTTPGWPTDAAGPEPEHPTTASEHATSEHTTSEHATSDHTHAPHDPLDPHHASTTAHIEQECA